MIQYTKNILDNGLSVICNTDTGTPFVSVNLLYKVGARDEDPARTGFAHLFEHLMFGGSTHVDDYDFHVQQAGGDSNAFTNNDYTNYYVTIPAPTVETALWLESDRMQGLAFSEKSLDVQRHVVIEEYKQRYLNAPYGDVWLHLRPLAYKVHPYRWPTIGKSIDHIANATLEDVKNFFHRFYAPDNAILSISGNIDSVEALRLAQKWFGDIPPARYERPRLPQEPRQTEERRLIVEGNNVPADAIYKAFHMGDRLSDDFYACDIISDILSNGQSSRLYVNLIKNSKIFSEIDAYVTGDMDPGLFVFSGKLSEGVDIETAEQAIRHEIEQFIQDPIPEREFQKVINKTEARIAYSEINYQGKSANLAFFDYLGDIALINNECSRYRNISVETLKNTARTMFAPENCSTLWYLKNKK